MKSVKLLALNISSDLKWNVHVSELVRKVSTRLYFLRQFKKSHVATRELLLFYITCICSFLEYCSPVFIPIIYPDLSYAQPLELSGRLRGSLRKSGPLDFATKNTFPLFFVSEEALVGIY